jgi:hypothetical protein
MGVGGARGGPMVVDCARRDACGPTDPIAEAADDSGRNMAMVWCVKGQTQDAKRYKIRLYCRGPFSLICFVRSCQTFISQAVMRYVWVYVLVSDNGRFFTVGVARDLEACFEHMVPENTLNFPRNLTAVYRVEVSEEAWELQGPHAPQAEEAEKCIALKIMKSQGVQWHHVLSSWGEFSVRDAPPPALVSLSPPILCFCGAPAERRRGKTGLEYYTCPRKNRDWLQRMAFPAFVRNRADNACDFYAHGSFYGPHELAPPTRIPKMKHKVHRGAH